MDEVVHRLLGNQASSIDLDPILVGIDLRAELGDDAPVHSDTACADQILGRSTRRHTGTR